MKKSFLTGLMALCVAAVSLSTVSCGKIEDELNDLKTQVEGLEQKIADLESKLNSDIAALNSVIAEKVAVVKVEEKDGVVVLTLANGKTLTVANSGKNNLVTTVTEGGKTYWAVVNADGSVKNLGVEVGQKLLFKINPETNELLVSYNGTDYEPTGVYVKDAQTINVVTGFEEAEDYVTITVGGKKYQLPKYAENGSLVLGRSNFFLMYGASKEVSLEANGIAEYFVMSKPDGWKASIEGTTLTVTAPSAEVAKLGAAEAEGEVLVHATTEAGKCVVAKLEVKTGYGLTLEADNNGNITINNAYAGLVVNQWMGTESYEFLNFICGFADPETFKADPKAYLNAVNDYNCWDPYGYYYNIGEMGVYVEGEYEVDVIKTTFADVYYSIMWEELDPSFRFIFWIAPMDDMGRADFSGLQYVASPATIKAELIEAKHNDIKVRITTYGADSYIISKVAESYYNSEWNPMTFEDYMTSAMGGPWTGFTQWGMPEALGLANENQGVTEVWLSDLVTYEGEEPSKLLFGETYKLWVFPMTNDKTAADYNFETDFLPYVFEFKTNDIVAGGNYPVEFGTPVTTYSSIAVDIIPAAKAETTFYYFYRTDDYAAFEEDEAAIREDLFLNCYWPLTGAETVSQEYLNPGDSFILAAVSVGADGKYGDIQTLAVSTKTIKYNDNITITASSVTTDADGNYVVVYDVKGATHVSGYALGNANNAANVETTTAKTGATMDYYGYTYTEVVDGKATVTYEANQYKTHFYGCAYNIVDGQVSELGAKTFVAAFADYIN